MTPADPTTRARNVAALAIAGHRISMARAQVIADVVIRELERTGWGGRPDVIDVDRLSFTCDWGGCDEETIAVRWDGRHKAYLPVCRAHLDADGATGGAP